MKNLILIRHAQAEPEMFPKRDFDRNLDNHGVNEAGKLAEFMFSRKEMPEAIVCSQANRTWQTGIAIAKLLKIDNVHTSLKLYNAGLQVLRDQISELDDALATIALVGHNPGISQAASYFSVNNSFQLATASAVCLSFEVNRWSLIQPASGKSKWYFTP